MKTPKLTIIGCGDAFGSGGRLTTCFYVQSARGNFLIDCGASAIPGLKKNNVNIDDIDTILLTHFHGDHYGGVPFLLLEAAVYGRTKPITIISPPGCRPKLEQLLALLYPGTEVLSKLDIRFIEYEPFETIKTTYLEVKAFPVVHSQAAQPHGLRIKVDDKIISYSGDTTWADNLIELSKDADLFICECNFFALSVKAHLNYHLLQTKLPLLSCKRILLTHFDTEMLQNREHVKEECAVDGMVVEL
jgi:ribonuclease BN (tRNA processing enzyme)